MYPLYHRPYTKKGPYFQAPLDSRLLVAGQHDGASSAAPAKPRPPAVKTLAKGTGRLHILRELRLNLDILTTISEGPGLASIAVLTCRASSPWPDPDKNE